MASTRSDSYLESRVLTAPPHRLHLMLVEGALRFGRQAEAALRAGDSAAASAPLLRTVDIVGEMLAGVRGGGQGELNDQLANFYWFLFRTVTAAKINNDAEKLADAIRLLEFERETWQLVCDKLDSEPAVGDQQSPANSDSAPAQPVPRLPRGGFAPPTSGNGISLEA